METESKKQSRSKLDLLTAVENIVDLSKDAQLSPEFYRKASRYIKHISTRLELTKEQSVMLALFIDQSDDCNIHASDIVKATGCRTTRVIRYTNDIDTLRQLISASLPAILQSGVIIDSSCRIVG